MEQEGFSRFLPAGHYEASHVVYVEKVFSQQGSIEVSSRSMDFIGRQN